MKPASITKAESAKIDKLVEHYRQNQVLFNRLVKGLHTLFTENDKLPSFIHSIKWRVKDPEHLRDKLCRRLLQAKVEKEKFGITRENLFEQINDLAGVRLLHLHTTQIEKIDQCIRELLAEEEYRIVEGPFARTWDDEYRAFFEKVNIATEPSGEMYTSVHYVVETHSRTRLTAEIQVRTLAEELWGEVTHSINYPHPTPSLACREQIKVLARITSSCTRLVDAIYKTHQDHIASMKPVPQLRRKAPKK